MSAVLAAISAAATLANTIISNVATSNANRENRALIDAQAKRVNDRHFKTQRGDLANTAPYRIARKETEDILAKFNSREAGTIANTGGTNEAKEVSKAQAYKAVADAETAAAEQSYATKEAEDKQYVQDMNTLDQQRMAMNTTKSSQVVQAAAQGISTGLNAMKTGIEGMESKPAGPDGSYVNPAQSQIQSDIIAANTYDPTKAPFDPSKVADTTIPKPKAIV